MKVLILNNHTKDLAQLTELFDRATVIERGAFKGASSLKGFDVLIISGGTNTPTVLHNADFYKDEIDSIRSASIPIIGICLGCELINVSLGGTLKQLDHLRMGDVAITLHDQGLISAIGEKTISAYEHHGVGIDMLGRGVEIAATSDHGPEIIFHTSLPIVGVQFHPEIRHQKGLFEWAFKKIGLEYTFSK